MSAVNSAAVAVLYRVNFDSLKEALDSGDLGLIRMTNGRAPTEKELDLVRECGPEEFKAVASLHRQAVDHSQHMADLSGRGLELLLKYDTGGLTVGQIRPLMSEEDGAEFDAIAEVIAPDGQVFFPGGGSR